MIRMKEHSTKEINRTGDGNAHVQAQHLEEGGAQQIQSAWTADVCVECVGRGNMKEEKWILLL